MSFGAERSAFTSCSSGWRTALRTMVSSLVTGIWMTIPAFIPFFSSGFRRISSTVEMLNFRQIRYIVSRFCTVYSIRFCTVCVSLPGKFSIRVGGMRMVFPMVKVEVERPGFVATISLAGTSYLIDSEYSVSRGCIV